MQTSTLYKLSKFHTALGQNESAFHILQSSGRPHCGSVDCQTQLEAVNSSWLHSIQLCDCSRAEVLRLLAYWHV